jgi:hypothetical protein
LKLANYFSVLDKKSSVVSPSSGTQMKSCRYFSSEEKNLYWKSSR